jgi:ferritin
MSARIEELDSYLTAIDKIDKIQQKFDDELDLLQATLHHQQVMLKNILEHVKVYVEAVEADCKRAK